MKLQRSCAALLLLSLSGCEAFEPSTLLSWTAGRSARFAPAGVASPYSPGLAELRGSASMSTYQTIKRENASATALTMGYATAMSPIAMPVLAVDAEGKPILPRSRPTPVIDLADIRLALRGGFDL